MTKQTAIRKPASLLERAAEIYDFEAALRGAGRMPEPEPQPEPEPELEIAPRAGPEIAAQPESAPAPARPSKPAPAAQPPRPAASGPVQAVDRATLTANGFILPDAPVTGLAEEYRIVKRQLLAGIARGADAKGRAVLICSSQPDEGKTFLALNLALSLAGEKEVEVLLVDGDFPKPEILSMLGLQGKAGLVDALADPAADPEAFVIRTDIPGLCVLPAGRPANNVPELLASARTDEVIARLGERHPRRIILFDSPPVLMASSASALAGRVGQAVVVVRADRTSEADLREAVRLLSGCERVSLLLNGAGFAATGRRFGSYYGYGR